MSDITSLEKANNTEKQRHVGIDMVKCMAIFSVVGVHFFINSKFYTTDLNNVNLFIQTFMQQLFLICIPLFLMSTGYLNNATKINKSYFKKIIPILVIYVLYSIPAILYRYSIAELPLDIGLWIKQLLTFKGHRYSWYINLYFGLFLLMPFLNRMHKTLELNEKKYIVIILITLTSATVVLPLPNYWGALYPLTYFYVGKYIKDTQVSMSKAKNILFLILIILLQAIIEYMSANGGEYLHVLTDYSSIFRLIEGYLLFILLYKIDINNKKIKKIIIDISSITLDIYLASFITDRLTYRVIKLFEVNQNEYLFLMIPLTIISFTFAYIIAKLRIKFVKVENIIK